MKRDRLPSMFGDGPLMFQEFVMNEPIPLAVIHSAVLEFLRGKDDAVLFGAQAVNAYVSEPRATQDVDVMSTRAPDLAEDIRLYLNDRFKIAVRVWNVRDGLGYRVYQLQKPANRHLVDIRPVLSFPPTQRVEGVLVVSPAELIANKVTALHSRKGKPKAGTDWRDIAVLVLTFPHLKQVEGPVWDRLIASNASDDVFAKWREIVSQDISAESDEDEFT